MDDYSTPPELDPETERFFRKRWTYNPETPTNSDTSVASPGNYLPDPDFEMYPEPETECQFDTDDSREFLGDAYETKPCPSCQTQVLTRDGKEGFCGYGHRLDLTRVNYLELHIFKKPRPSSKPGQNSSDAEQESPLQPGAESSSEAAAKRPKRSDSGSVRTSRSAKKMWWWATPMVVLPPVFEGESVPGSKPPEEKKEDHGDQRKIKGADVKTDTTPSKNKKQKKKEKGDDVKNDTTLSKKKKRKRGNVMTTKLSSSYGVGSGNEADNDGAADAITAGVMQRKRKHKRPRKAKH